MSDTFDIEEQRVRIRRAIEESEKFSAEQRKLTIEQEKLAAEQRKLYAEESKLLAEALKLQRDRLLSPWFMIIAIFGGIGGTIAGITAIINLVRASH
jgi:hypothetical protein